MPRALGQAQKNQEDRLGERLLPYAYMTLFDMSHDGILSLRGDGCQA